MSARLRSGLLDPETDDPDDSDARPLRDLERLVGGACTDCRRRYAAGEAVFSIVLGFKNAPRCLSCLAHRLGRDQRALREQLVAHIHRRECFLRAWRAAERIGTSELDRLAFEGNAVAEVPNDVVPAIAAEWDAGDMGCGELVMALRLRMNDVPAGAILKVTANDPAAPEDLPAWCRMSGHTLVAMQHPIYFIRRKGD